MLVGAAEPLNNPMGVQLAPDGKLLVVDSAPWLPRSLYSLYNHV